MEARNIVIRKIDNNDVASVQNFLLGQLQDLFSHDGQSAITDDVWGLAKLYIEPARNQMWAAFSPEGAVIGTIAICEYNDRIAVLKGRYPGKTTAEIGRCYIEKTLRRQGIGSRLLKEVEAFGCEKEYETIYLHTHRFLPGGFHFWEKQGFRIVVEEQGDAQIVHMEKSVASK
ncbi:GNAT family N-acetyltransferase [Pelosinus fermentans]|jgi:GNAT superfamily N-acetyltransferase|uniref:GCN5-related N-acetyltransferase n=1 Tax=Pelosinus fermentans B4 TaxID=1149862 RepID=I8RC44_9FIRM|nr:GNAT family N-acetyltransferase [Pelosinus fermentans]EIW16668.1 GCN5-related N-acetyltransferase [Pelosinus fermentans B4]EIW22842.1 GCN5-related N-acetyltransferase [Pelosinus fermentans A11]MBP2660330.1 GCN5-related N-acetyltransferase [Bacillota bacterium]